MRREPSATRELIGLPALENSGAPFIARSLREKWGFDPEHHSTVNLRLLISVSLGVVTRTKPVVAPIGTTAVKYVSEITENLAPVPLKDMAVVPVRPCPRTATV